MDLQAEDLRRRLEDRDIRLELTEDARRFIAEAGYDPVYGARPLKRYMQRQLETRIGRAIVAGEIADGATVSVRVCNGNLVVKATPRESAEEPADA